VHPRRFAHISLRRANPQKDAWTRYSSSLAD